MTHDTPEKMSAAELAKIRERDAAIAPIVASGAKIDGALIVAALDDRVRLLAHIAALEAERAPAASCDREAPSLFDLGIPAAALAEIERAADGAPAAVDLEAFVSRLLIKHVDCTGQGPTGEARAAYVAIIEEAHALGAASRQGEIDALRAELASREAKSLDLASKVLSQANELLGYDERLSDVQADARVEVERLTRAHEAQLLDAIRDRDDAQQEAEEAEEEKRVMAAHLVAARAEVERERSRADEMCATEGERARTCERLHAEIDRLTAELHAAREAYASVKVGRDLCGRLLWETRADLGLATPSDPIDWDDLSEESKERFRALGAGMFGAMREGHARHVACKFEGEIARLTAELAAERAKADRRWTDQDTAMREAARAEGAREEREACIADIAVIAKSNDLRIKDERALVGRIRARGEGDPR